MKISRSRKLEICPRHTHHRHMVPSVFEEKQGPRKEGCRLLAIPKFYSQDSQTPKTATWIQGGTGGSWSPPRPKMRGEPPDSQAIAPNAARLPHTMCSMQILISPSL